MVDAFVEMAKLVVKKAAKKIDKFAEKLPSFFAAAELDNGESLVETVFEAMEELVAAEIFVVLILVDEFKCAAPCYLDIKLASD